MSQGTKNQARFFSARHIGHSESMKVEVLNPQNHAQYSVKNLAYMRVADLQLALYIEHLSKSKYKAHCLDIATTDEAYKHIVELMEREKCFAHTIDSSMITLLNTPDSLDLNTAIVRLMACLNDDNQTHIDMETLLNQLKDYLRSHQKENTLFHTFKDYDFSSTQLAFSKAGLALDEVLGSLEHYAEEAKQEFNSRRCRDIISLGLQVFDVMAPFILKDRVGKDMAGQILSLFFDTAVISPWHGLLAFCRLLIGGFMFYVKTKDNAKIQAAYEMYSVIVSLYNNLDYSLMSLLNFAHSGVGNLAVARHGNTLSCYMYPQLMEVHSAFLDSFLRDHTLNFKDISYRAMVSFYNIQAQDESYIRNILTHNNQDEKPTKLRVRHNTQFSTFSTEHLCKIYQGDIDNNITHSSAFQHLQNMFLRFDNFLFIKTPILSSTLAGDMLRQSFTQSNQSNRARTHKTALILTNCIHNGTPEYHAQQYIKTRIFDHTAMKHNVLFLSAMFRVKKVDFVNSLIEKLSCLLEELASYDSSYAQHKDMVCHIGKAIQTHGLGETKCNLSENTKSYSLDHVKLCKLDEYDFCAFIYDLCSAFIKQSPESIDREANNICESELQQAAINQRRILNDMTTAISDVFRLFTHFNASKIADIRQYQNYINEAYRAQKKTLKDFFQKKTFQSQTDKELSAPNIFYGLTDTHKLCIALLNKYFYKKPEPNEMDLDSLFEEGRDKVYKLESSKLLQANNQQALYQIALHYIVRYLPLEKFVFACLKEEEVVLFTNLIVFELNTRRHDVEKSARMEGDTHALFQFVETYEATLSLCALLQVQNKREAETLFERYDVLRDVYDILAKYSQKETRDLKSLRDELIVPFQSLFDSSGKEIAKKVASVLVSHMKDKHADLISVEFAHTLSAFLEADQSFFTSLCKIILDHTLPIQVRDIDDMRRGATLLFFVYNRHRNTPYATCRQGSEYLTFPIEITQTLVNADLQAIILGGATLDSGFCIHTPSIALFNENRENAIKTLKETLRHFMNNKVSLRKLGDKGGGIIKEAYAKLWFYLDMGENKEIEQYLRHEIKAKPRYFTLENLTGQAYIATKLKKAQGLSNSDDNFMQAEGNAKGGIRFNRDFLIQLKRVAEWNYRVYEEKEVLGQTEQDEPDRKDSNKDPSPDEWLGGNLIYNEEFIPTTIDIVD